MVSRRWVAVAVLAAGCAGGVATGTPHVIARDRGARSPQIAWPPPFSPSADPVFAHNERSIAAPCDRVWGVLVDAPRWPGWYRNARDVRLGGGVDVLGDAVTFHWTTFDIQVDSTVFEHVRNEGASRLGWYGKAKDLDACHRWLLLPEGGGCRVITEEVVRGPAAEALRSKAPAALHDGHAVWLEALDAEVARHR
ncbi:MAG: hypothetical protein HOO96_07355 [Polyangiaceae bacterium]|nr:hypothetical protein [Polyangiaceae bacterium]